MRTCLLAAALLSVAGTAVPAAAQENPRAPYWRYARDADPRRPADWRAFAAYDHDRLETGQVRYYPERYRRDGRYYAPLTLGRDDRLYRGGGWSFYCRRDDGTTGLVTGMPSRGALENALGKGESQPLATLAAGDARLGAALDAGRLVCR